MCTATLLNSFTSFPTLSVDSPDFSRQILCFAKGTCKQYKFWLSPFQIFAGIASFYCILQTLCFLQIKDLRQPCVKKVYWCHFSNNILLILWLCVTKSWSFSLLFYLLWWSVTSDVTTVSVWGTRNHAHTDSKPSWQTLWVFSPLHPLAIPPPRCLLGPPYSLRHNSTETGPLNTI